MFVKYNSITHFIKLSILSATAGIISGSAASLFLHSLKIATDFREANEWIIYFLPIAGLSIGLLYHHYGKDVAGGNNLILQEIHDPNKKISPFMAPFILLGTVVTHLFGGSAGREGTAVQMSASLCDQLSHYFKLTSMERRAFLVLGAGAGFGSAVGAPISGIIFGMEVIYIGQLRAFAIVECVTASFIGYYTTIFLKTPHTHYFTITDVNYDLMTILLVGLAGCLFGFVARFFSNFTHICEDKFKLISYPPVKPLIGGILLVILYKLEGSFIYDGLGIDTIKSAFISPTSLLVPVKKMIFTSITLASGFKGGEFVPLVFIGTTLGSVLGLVLPVSFQLLASLGFASVFAGASNTPMACTLMAMELFGWKIGPYALIACYISYYVSGDLGIYKAQKKVRPKHHFIRFIFKKGFRE